MSKDILGRPATELEEELLRVYEDVKKLAVRKDAPPCVARNARKALASLWQAKNDLCLGGEQLYDLGV